MSKYDFDLFVIGAGSGGVRAGRLSAGFGAKVAVAEERHFGGTCVNIGCVPKKLMVYASHFAEEFHDAEGFGWTVGSRTFDWSRLIANKDQEIGRLNRVYRGLLEKAGVEIFEARAKVAGAHTVEVGGRRITARHILVATGGRPERPREPGQELAIVSDDVFYLDRQPERLLVAGGGYIAVEFAGIFNGLGTKTTQLYRGPLFLRGFDEDVRSFLAEEMPKKGIELVFNQIIERIERSENGLVAHFTEGERREFDQVLYAIGRRPNTAGLGLEEAGVELTPRGAVKVDSHFRSSLPSLYAIGDVTDRIQLTPVALAEGMAVARTLFGGERSVVDYADVPTAVFSQPPAACVGLTEAAARGRFGSVEVYRSIFRPLKHTLSGSPERTLMKLVVERESRRVVGAHMVGLDAAEIIQGVAVAIRAGATKEVFDATIGIHPTAAEEFVTMREPLPDPELEAAQ